MADADDVHVLIAQLRDVYDVERQLRRVIAGLSRRASPASVRKAFETHLTAIWREIVRLESVFEWLETGARERRRPGDIASADRYGPLAPASAAAVRHIHESRSERRSYRDRPDPSASHDDSGPADQRASESDGSTSTRSKAESRLPARVLPAHGKRS